MMRLKGWLFLVLVLILVLVSFVYSTNRFENSSKFREKYTIYSQLIPKNLDFAGERVPLEYFDVFEGLDREIHINTYWQSQTIFLLKKVNRYFPEIEPILKEENVPSDFKYLVVAESSLTNIASPSNAEGFWQFLKNTGKDYGLEINNEIDERYNLEKSTHAACKFLKESFKIYGSWTMAAASYNIGRPGLSKHVKSQKEGYYYNLFLNEETARYIFRILAMKMIVENPELYGFHIQKKDLYPPFKFSTVKVDTSISDLAAFAKKFNTNYKLLKIFNPWLRNDQLTNKIRKEYFIRIPDETFRESAYENIFDSADSIQQRP